MLVSVGIADYFWSANVLAQGGECPCSGLRKWMVQRVMTAATVSDLNDLESSSYITTFLHT